jgi:uncharacterized Zn finger protein
MNHMDDIASLKAITAAKNYARAGKVIELIVTPGLVEARVQGRRKAPYRVRLYSPCPDDNQLEEIKRKLCEKAKYRSQLLLGEMPFELDEIFKSAGVCLSLERFSRSQRICGCSEPEDVCKHILAAIYVAAVAFDRDPFLLLKLRGLDKEVLLTTLSSPVASDGEPIFSSLTSEASTQENPECGGYGDNSPPELPPAMGAAFYGPSELPQALNYFRKRRVSVGEPATVFDFPLWRGEMSFAESIAPYYKSVEKFFRNK